VHDLAVANNIVEKSGAWYSYDGERIGQGRENTRNFLKENKNTFAKIDGELRKKLNIGASKAEIPEVPSAGPAEAKEAVRARRG
jgi:recombination protein RecA